jgi:hypothetical protein
MSNQKEVLKHINITLKELGEQIKPKVSKQKELTNSRAEINKIEIIKQ